MPKLLLANLGSLVTGPRASAGGRPALSAEEHCYLRAHAHRALWCAESGDVVVLPAAPDPDFVRHVARTTGVDHASLSVLVPPFGEAGVHVPLGPRSRSTPFEDELLRVAVRHGVDRISPYYFDTAVASLAGRLGLADGTDGCAFMAQGGGELLNDKATFRLLAAGTGAAVPPGLVTSHREQAERYLWSLLGAGHPAVLKRARHVGGRGNVLLTPAGGVEPVGMNDTVIVDSPRALARHLAVDWADYTGPAGDAVVVERYFPGSASLYVGLHISADRVTSYGHGEMRMAPRINGLIVPAPAAASAAFADFLAQARRLGEATRAMGYRGRLSVDAILTPAGEILLTEFNARAGGGTHAHVIAALAGASRSPHDRVLLDCRFWPGFALDVSLDLLAARDLAYDPHRRRGVLITVHDKVSSPPHGELCAVADTLEGAAALEAAAIALLSPDPRPALENTA